MLYSSHPDLRVRHHKSARDRRYRGTILHSQKLGAATPHLIYGFNSEELDVGGTAVADYTLTMYGVHVVIPVAKTFLIRPELMFYDYEGALGTDAGKQMVAGICFMIAF